MHIVRQGLYIHDETELQLKLEKKNTFVLSPMLYCSCFKCCALVFCIPQNVEIEPLRTGAMNDL
jgi:hypothetical protein